MKNLGIAAFILALVCGRSHAATFTVTNITASGPGSLSNAVVQANATAASDTIEFNIPGVGVRTITLLTPLPDITAPLIIDGYTQPGSSPNTLANGDNAMLLVEISGDNNMDGLTFKTGSTNSAVRGLVLNQFIRAVHFNGVNTLAGANAVEGCFIGTTPDGRATKGNNSQAGVFTSNNGAGNRVGGTTPAARNVIACATGNGIQIDVNSVSNVVQGNFIGVDATGTNALGGQSGIFVNNGAHNCLIGGASAAARNIITSAGGGYGIQCNNSTGHLIQGNFIGTDVTGTRLLGLMGHGVSLGNASASVVGGITAVPGTPPGNVIAGGIFSGIGLFDNAVVQGNLIGTDVAGTRALGSGQDGITVGGAKNCVIGGTNAGARNVISGHGRRGIDFESGGATNVIQGNFIGTDITGTNPLPNGTSGIYLGSGRDNVIGPDNVIAFNAGDGITSDSAPAINNRITANAIFANGTTGMHLGIDLGLEGPTGNDDGDADTGPNLLQNVPVLTNVVFSAGTVTISGTLNSSANSSFRLEFFSNPSCDLGGNGEGRMFLGFANVTTDASGDVPFSVNLPAAGGPVITATATDANGNTSEFSSCTSGALPCTINCSTNIVVSTAPGQCGANVSFPAPTITGDCGPVTCSPPSGSLFAKGMTLVTCSSTNGTNCSFTVTVADTEPPMISCPANIVTNAPPGQTSVAVNFAAAVATDNCPGATSSCLPASGSLFPLGTTTVTCTAADASGNTNLCSFTVTVNETPPPVVTCTLEPALATNVVFSMVIPQVFVFTNGEPASDVLVSFLIISGPNAGETNFDVTTGGQGGFPYTSNGQVGTDVIQASGNVAGQSFSCLATQVWIMNPCPTITLSPSTLPDGIVGVPYNQPVTASGSSATPFTFTFAQGDAPSGLFLSSLGAVMGTPTAPDTSSFTIQATDTNGCIGTRDYTLTINPGSNSPPVAMCRDVTTNAGTNCQVTVAPAQVDNGSFDPDGTIVSRTLNPPGPYARGTTPVTLTVVDNQGASNSCSASVVVVDATPPVLSGCQNVTAVAPAGAFGTNVNFVVTALDNCDGVVAVACTPAPGFFALGQTFVTCEAVDSSGNRSTCTFAVTVTPPGADGICTFGQGFYGNARGRFNGLTSLTLVGNLLGQGTLIVGKTGSRSLSILPADTTLLQERLPAGGTPATLPNNGEQTLQTATLPLNAKGRFMNVLLGQTITLSLNVRLSPALLGFDSGPAFCTQGVLSGPDGVRGSSDDVPVPADIQMFNIPDSVLSALANPGLGINDSTAQGLLELANRALAGLPTAGATLADINDAVDAINRGFDECRALVNCATNTVVPDSFNDSFTNRPGLGAEAAFAISPSSSLNIQVRTSNLDADKEPGEPNHAGNPGGKSVWWQWRAPRSGPVTIHTRGSSFDTLLGVYTGTAISNLVPVASNDDADSLLTSEVAFNVVLNTVYQIAVDGSDGAAGSIVLTLIADPPRLCLPLTVLSNQVQLCVEGEPNRTYGVEASPDLSNWTLIAAPVNSDGTLRFEDPAMSNYRQRFYRVMFEP